MLNTVFFFKRRHAFFTCAIRKEDWAFQVEHSSVNYVVAAYFKVLLWTLYIQYPGFLYNNTGQNLS